MKKPIIKAEAAGVARVGSGPVQFGSDWPGLFLRGDHAIKVAQCVRHLQKNSVQLQLQDDWAFKFLVELAVLIENEIETRKPPSD